MRRAYPSDISREQFAKILSVLEQSRKRTRPRTVDLYEVFCAVLYVLKSGCQWRMLPRDFPNWMTCYAYWQQWKEPRDAHGGKSLLQVALKKWGWRGPAEPWAQRQDNLRHR